MQVPSTEVVLSIALFLLIVGATSYDVIVFGRDGVDPSISAVLLAAAKRQPILPFLAGVLAGHLFWTQ